MKKIINKSLITFFILATILFLGCGNYGKEYSDPAADLDGTYIGTLTIGTTQYFGAEIIVTYKGNGQVEVKPIPDQDYSTLTPKLIKGVTTDGSSMVYSILDPSGRILYSKVIESLIYLPNKVSESEVIGTFEGTKK